jgi:hypothetical protein
VLHRVKGYIYIQTLLKLGSAIAAPRDGSECGPSVASQSAAEGWSWPWEPCKRGQGAFHPPPKTLKLAIYLF